MYELDQYTVSLLHFKDGIKDETGKVWTAQNGAAISTTQSKFSGSSLYLNGTNQYLITANTKDFDFGNGDFTIDWWEYRTGVTNHNQSVFASDCNAYCQPILVGDCGIDNSNEMYCYLSSNNASWDIAQSRLMGTTILNEWVHYAICRKGSMFYTFQNGILQDSWTSLASLAKSTGSPGIGKYNTQGHFPGYIDEFRISKIARWTENFTSSSESTTPVSGEILLKIILSEEVEREYSISKSQLNSFVSWYDNRSKGTGALYYTFDKGFKRKDYLVFDKILTFEVMDFTK